MNQRDIEAARRLISQFNGGTGRHNSNLIDRDIRRLRSHIQTPTRALSVLKPSFEECEIGEFTDGGSRRVPQMQNIKLLVQKPTPPFRFVPMIDDPHYRFDDVMEFERAIIQSGSGERRIVWKRVA